MKRDLDVEDFPVGTRVMTPTGRKGTVIRHRGAESKLDRFLRVTVQMDGGPRHDLVTLRPACLPNVRQPTGFSGIIGA